MYTLWTITAANISKVRGLGYTTARKEWNAIRDALGVKQLTCKQAAAYYDLDVKTFAEMLYLTGRK